MDSFDSDQNDFWSERRRYLAFVLGVLLPVNSFLGSSCGMIWSGNEPWQSELWKTKAHLMLTWPAVWPFLPLLAFAMTSYMLWCFWPHYVRRYFIWRLGIYTGVLFAIQMFFLLFPVVSVYELPSLLVMQFIGGVATMIAIAAPAMILFAMFQKHIYSVTAILAIMFYAAFYVCVIQLQNELGDVFELFFSITGVFSPFLAIILYLNAAINIWKTNTAGGRFSIFSVMGVTAWFSANFAAWRMSIDIMMVEYNKLPVEDPNCYVSSAAAHGHRRFVGRIIDEHMTGKVNRQMQYLKAGEFMLCQTFPTAHKIARRFYNLVGPKFAKAVSANVWLADASYLIFLPIEFTVRLIVKLSRINQRSIERIYLNKREK